MSEPHDQQPEKEKQSDQQKSDDMFGEMRKFGLYMEQAARSVMENKQVRAMHRDFVAGMQELFTQVQTTAKNIQDNPQVQNFSERGQQAFNQMQEKMRENKTVREAQEQAARMLAYFNVQIDQFNQRMEQRNQEAADKEAAEQASEKPEPPASQVTPVQAAQAPTTEPPADAPEPPASQVTPVQAAQAPTTEPPADAPEPPASQVTPVQEEDKPESPEQAEESPVIPVQIEVDEPPAASSDTPGTPATGQTIRLDDEREKKDPGKE